MRRARIVWLGLLALSLTGCLHDRPARSSSLLDRFRMNRPSGPDAVFIEYAVIERPAGNAAMNRDIWANIDELILPSDTRALLAENGFRVGVVGGLLNSELEAMISNPKSSTGHRHRELYVNNPAAIPVNGPVPLAEFLVRNTLDAKPSPAKFEEAKFAMSFTPSHAGEGRIALRCVPEMEYQDKKQYLPTGAAGPGWLSSKPLERYATLAFDMKLSPREFLVIGTQYDRGAWLGNQVFTGVEGTAKVQRLLIIRAGRLHPNETGLEPNAPKDGVVPLASQASARDARGQRP